MPEHCTDCRSISLKRIGNNLANLCMNPPVVCFFVYMPHLLKRHSFGEISRFNFIIVAHSIHDTFSLGIWYLQALL